MLVFPTMLVPAAERANIAVPPDLTDETDIEKIKNEFPHFFVFCQVQLSRPMSEWTSHWDNAEVIARVPADEIRQITLEKLVSMGLEYAYA